MPLYKITQEELLKMFRYDEQGLFALLKKKGAPIKGTFYLEPEEGYDWMQTTDIRTQDVIYTVTKSTEQDEISKNSDFSESR